MIKLYCFFTITLLCSSGFAQLQCADLLRSSSAPAARELMVQAVSFYKAGNFNNSEKKLRAILARSPRDYRALGLLSRVLYNKRDFAEALVFQLDAIRYEPSYSEGSYFSLAQIHSQLGNLFEANSAIDEVLLQNPEHSAALGMKAKFLLSMNRLEEAYIAIMIKQEFDIKNLESLSFSESLLAEYYLKKGFYNKALKRANNLITTYHPRKGQIKVPKAYMVGMSLRAKVLVLLTRKNYAEEALETLKTLETYFSETPLWILRVKAEAQFRSGQTNGSKKTLVEIIRRSSGVNYLALADLTRIEDQDSELMNVLFGQLSDEEVVTVMKLAASSDWDYLPDDEIQNLGPSIKNNFWFGLHNLPVNTVTRRSTF